MKNKTALVLAVIAATSVTFSQSAHAGYWEGGRGHGHRHYRSSGHHHDGISIVFRYGRPFEYYRPAPRYVVVEKPVVVVQQPVVIPSAPAVVTSQEIFPINIPNKTGGYTTVNIKRSGNGFVGPQGEFYAEFPSVEQLKVMYAKT